jgi:hypothetical protein
VEANGPWERQLGRSSDESSRRSSGRYAGRLMVVPSLVRDGQRRGPFSHSQVPKNLPLLIPKSKGTSREPSFCMRPASIPSVRAGGVGTSSIARSILFYRESFRSRPDGRPQALDGHSSRASCSEAAHRSKRYGGAIYSCRSLAQCGSALGHRLGI